MYIHTDIHCDIIHAIFNTPTQEEGDIRYMVKGALPVVSKSVHHMEGRHGVCEALHDWAAHIIGICPPDVPQHSEIITNNYRGNLHHSLFEM